MFGYNDQSSFILFYLFYKISLNSTKHTDNVFSLHQLNYAQWEHEKNASIKLLTQELNE